ncbi:MAG: hypothetical protein ABIV48_03895 [Pyrinomonadaceae bacterium]
MTMVKAIEPQEWATFLNAFSHRNRGRRARFEIFGPKGGIKEEAEEGKFESISMDGSTVTVKRRYTSRGQEKTMTDELKNIRGISVQYDTDKSENVLEFMDSKNNMTVLHFESRVDGDS